MVYDTLYFEIDNKESSSGKRSVNEHVLRLTNVAIIWVNVSQH